MESFDDPDAYGIAHIGWGMLETAKWGVLAYDRRGMGMHGRSFYGNVLFSTGPNGELGGTNETLCHVDVPMRNCTLDLDDGRSWSTARSSSTAQGRRGRGMSFQNPFEVETPAGAEGWEGMYPYYVLLLRGAAGSEEGRFWFFDGMHNPSPIYPFDTIMTENWWVACNQLTTRVLRSRRPAASTTASSTATSTSARTRSPTPRRSRSGPRTSPPRRPLLRELGRDLRGLGREGAGLHRAAGGDRVPPLPEIEDEERVTGHRASTAARPAHPYDRLIENLFEMGAYHFEMLNLGYGAYLTFREFCQRRSPASPTRPSPAWSPASTSCCSGPTTRCASSRPRARAGAGRRRQGPSTPPTTRWPRWARERGDEWLAALEAAKEPWFWYSTGAGYTHTDRAWPDDLRLPFNAMRGYIEKLEAGEDIERPLERIVEERERITAEYRELLGTDEDRAAFEELVQLARTVYPYVENHNFYVEHWHHWMFWNKVRELGRRVRRGRVHRGPRGHLLPAPQ